MNTNTTTKDLLDLALNGSPNFQAKVAAADPAIPPDEITPGHTALAEQIQGVADMLSKTAEYVEKGYPAKGAMLYLTKLAGANPEYATKIEGLLDDLGKAMLESAVHHTYYQKEAALQTAKQAAQTGTLSPRTASALARARKLNELARQG